MSRLGMDYEALRRERADLIYCAISGFGQDTSMAGKPAYDQIVQGMSGAMSTTGDADSGPVRAGYPVCDTVAGMNAAFAVASALLHRERTGEGQFIDVSMLETTISVMGWVTSNWLIAGQPPVPSGNDNFTASPSGAFRVADGLINIAANQQKQFEALCRELGREDLLADARYANPDIRLEHRDALKAALERTLTERPGAEWVARLDKVGVPVGPVLDVPTALALPPIAERGVVQRLQGVPDVPRPVDIFTAGWRMSGGAPRIGGLPPRLGEHSDRILRDLGYSSAQIVQWREAGVI
jgi:formyl-CoA transferase